MNNYINRFLFDDSDIRGEIITLDKVLNDALIHQELPDSLRAVFGEFLAGAALLAEILKFEGILTLQARGDGDVVIIMAEATHDGRLRGIVRPHPEREFLPEDHLENDLRRLLGGHATLSITIDPIRGQRYQGIVPLDKANLSECLHEYFAQSEQLPTSIQLFANAQRCGGLFLQCLPAQKVTDLERRGEQWNTAVHLALTLSEDELFSLHNEEILTRLFHELNCRVFPPKALAFRCTCDRERSLKAIESLSYDDAAQLVAENGGIKVDCQFCGKHYEFGLRDLETLFLASKPRSH